MLANFQFQVHVQLACCRQSFISHRYLRGQSNISSSACPRSFSPFYHPSTLTRLPDTGSPFPNSTSISFFIPPINTVFYLIERLRQYFILLNDVIKNRKRRACVEAMTVQHCTLHARTIVTYVNFTFLENGYSWLHKHLYTTSQSMLVCKNLDYKV